MEDGCVANTLQKISPLHELAMPRLAKGAVGVELSERLCDSLVQVQAWPDTIANVQKLISKATSKNAAVMATGPGRWLIEEDVEGMEDRLRASITPDLGAITGLTHARVVVSIDGPKAEWLLATGIALNFDLSAFPVTTTQLSHHHEIGVTIHRTSDESFDLYVFTSYARGLWQWIERAGEEVGLSIG